MLVMEPKTETAETCIYGDDCPLYAENPPFNAKTLTAMREARDMMDGAVRAEWNHPPATKEELKAQLRKMLQE